jgi:hypothetical protein
VYDAIQVWDMARYVCVNIIPGQVLDADGFRSCCFGADDSALFCGTNRGFLRVFDLETANILGTYRHPDNLPRNYICDLKVRGSCLLAVDWFGSLQKWTIRPDKSLVFSSRLAAAAEAGAIATQYSSKHKERRIEFNEAVAVTNVRQIVAVWELSDESACPRFVQTESDVLCTKVMDRFVFWGEQNGTVHQVHFPGSAGPAVTVGVVQTAFKDSVTSLSVTPDVAVFGDKNGEISCYRLPLAASANVFVLESGHDFGAFVWAVQESILSTSVSDENLFLNAKIIKFHKNSQKWI